MGKRQIDVWAQELRHLLHENGHLSGDEECALAVKSDAQNITISNGRLAVENHESNLNAAAMVSSRPWPHSVYKGTKDAQLAHSRQWHSKVMGLLLRIRSAVREGSNETRLGFLALVDECIGALYMHEQSLQSVNKSVYKDALQMHILLSDLHRYRAGFQSSSLVLSEGHARTALDIDPGCGRAWNQLGVIHTMRGRPVADALVCYARAGACSAPFGPASQNLARAASSPVARGLLCAAVVLSETLPTASIATSQDAAAACIASEAMGHSGPRLVQLLRVLVHGRHAFLAAWLAHGRAADALRLHSDLVRECDMPAITQCLRDALSRAGDKCVLADNAECAAFANGLRGYAICDGSICLARLRAALKSLCAPCPAQYVTNEIGAQFNSPKAVLCNLHALLAFNAQLSKLSLLVARETLCQLDLVRCGRFAAALRHYSANARQSVECRSLSTSLLAVARGRAVRNTAKMLMRRILANDRVSIADCVESSHGAPQGSVYAAALRYGSSGALVVVRDDPTLASSLVSLGICVSSSVPDILDTP